MSSSTIHAKRWRLASVAIYCSRAFLPRLKQQESINKNTASRLMNEVSADTREISPAPSESIVQQNPFSSDTRQIVIDVLVQQHPFLSDIDHSILTELVKEKSLNQLSKLGGVEGIATSLKTDQLRGISGDPADIVSRRQAFGRNTYQKPHMKSFFHFIWEAFKDPTILILLVFAALSLGFGIKKGWYDGASILAVLFLFISVSAVCNFRHRQFDKHSQISNDITVEVVRNIKRQQIPISEIVVGDVVRLKIGDQVPADGLYVNGDSLRVNESVLKKEAKFVEMIHAQNPFLLAGSKVTNGHARMLVTALGMNTKWGEMMMMSSPCPMTPLQLELHKLTWIIAYVGLAVASMVFMVLLLRYFTRNLKVGSRFFSHYTSFNEVCGAIIGILVISMVIGFSAISEGLLLATKVTLAYSTRRMASGKAMVRNPAACEAIGSISVICVDRSSTISSNSPTVEQFWLGQMNSKSVVLQLLQEGIHLDAMTDTTYASSSEFDDELQTKKATRAWAVQELGMNLGLLMENCSVVDPGSLNLPVLPQGSICIRRKIDDTVHIHMKGSIDMILATCSQYYDENGEIKILDPNATEKLMKIVQKMKNDGLNCIAYAHAAVLRDLDDNHFHPELQTKVIFTLIGFLGLKFMLRPNISKALKEFQQAGVGVIMMTIEDVPKAKESALRCGMFSPDETINTDDIIEGIEFSTFTAEEREVKIGKIRVIARASTPDKLLLVQCLKQKGHTVGVVGGCPGDEVFEEADVSFYLGIQESHSMKKKPDIIILDDSFTAVERAMRWGRGIYNNIQIYAQFQLTATIASLVTDSVTAIFEGKPPHINIVTLISSGKVPSGALQILWVKLIVDSLVVLALSIDDPAESLNQEMPIVDQSEPFITNIMWRDIIGQALCQITILLTIRFKGESTFKLKAREKDTLIFNIFVLYQIFNIFNILKGKYILERLHKRRLFCMVMGIIIPLQVIIIELSGNFAKIERLNWKQWRVCIGLAIISWLTGWLLRIIPVPKKPFFCYLCSRNHTSEV